MPAKEHPKTPEEQGYRPPDYGESDIRQVLNTLDRVFSTFREQLREEAPNPFTGNAKIAVDTFNNIVAGVRLETRPGTIQLSGKRLSDTEIELTWTSATGTVDFYRVERCQGYGCQDLDEVGRAGGTERSFRDSNLSADTHYRYRVVALNFRGETPSNIIDVSTR